MDGAQVAPTGEGAASSSSKPNLTVPSNAALGEQNLITTAEEGEAVGEDVVGPVTSEIQPSEERAGGQDKHKPSNASQKKMSRFSFITDQPLPVELMQPVVEGPLAYEWESAKSKPHARIISRKYPKWETIRTGEMKNLFGWTHQGKANPPRAVLIGRTHDTSKIDGRPSAYSGVAKAGEYKPNALILSRHKPIEVGCGSGEMQNIYGWTRFGKAYGPRPLILSRPIPEDKHVPGPGIYDSHPAVDRRVGIRIKSRLKYKELDETPAPNEYYLGTFMCDGPEFSIIGRHGLKIISHSPGPIYDIRQGPCKKKGLSMTFKPFPWKMQKEYPSPNEYSIKPGDQRKENTLLKGPRVKFAGKPYDPNKDYTSPQCDTGPGPGDFNLSAYKATAKDKPRAIICSRPKMTYEFCGSGPLVNLYGKTRFGARRPPHCVAVSRHYPKDKSEPGPGAYDPHKYIDKRVGITMKPRWKSPKLGETGPGPADYNLPQMRKGPAFSLVPRFRRNMSILEKVPREGMDIECKRRLIRELEDKQKQKCSGEQKDSPSTGCDTQRRQRQPVQEKSARAPRACSEFDEMFSFLDKYLQT